MESMIALVCTVCVFVLVSFVSATILVVCEKMRLFEYYNMHAYRLRLPKDLCIFCIGFWLSVAQVIAIYLLFNKQELYFPAPFAAASLTRVIYENIKPKGR